jgi:hypothetical protein
MNPKTQSQINGLVRALYLVPSPVLKVSQLFYFPPLINMLKFGGLNKLNSGKFNFKYLKRNSYLRKITTSNRVKNSLLNFTEDNNTPTGVLSMYSGTRG